MSQDYGTPEFARIEIRMSNKEGLRNAAKQLRDLAGQLDAIASDSMADSTSNFLAWGNIKTTSQKLRAGN